MNLNWIKLIYFRPGLNLEKQTRFSESPSTGLQPATNPVLGSDHHFNFVAQCHLIVHFFVFFFCPQTIRQFDWLVRSELTFLLNFFSLNARTFEPFEDDRKIENSNFEASFREALWSSKQPFLVRTKYYGSFEVKTSSLNYSNFGDSAISFPFRRAIAALWRKRQEQPVTADS